MPKIEVNKVAEILQRNQLAPELLRTVVEEMNLIAQPEIEEDTPPPVKKQHCILISDPNHVLPDGQDLVGWVLQIPENESVLTTEGRVIRAAYEFNTTKRGRLKPVETIGEAIENIPAKHFKEAGVYVRTKIPVLMLKTGNEIPREKPTRRNRHSRD